MDPCDKDDCIDPGPKNHLVCENFNGKEAYHEASKTSKSSDMPGKGNGHTMAEDKKNTILDSGCEVDNISCISKADGSNGTVTGDQKNLTGSSDSVNSFIQTESEKASDVQSLKYISAGSACIVECNKRLKGSGQYARGGLQSTGDYSDKSDPSETSSVRGDHAGASSPKVSLSSGQGVDKLSNVPDHTHNFVDSVKLETKLDAGQSIDAMSRGSEQNEHIDPKEPSYVKELPLQCQVANDVKEVELVDVRLCDICGDAGREYLLALCSRCNDGAEHTYCMRVKMDKLPEDDWVCEDCLEIENPRKRLVDIVEGTGEVRHDDITSSGINSSKGPERTNMNRTFSQLGKRPSPDPLMNPKAKKRADASDVRLPGSSGASVKPVVLKDSNLKYRESIVRPGIMVSSCGDSPRKALTKAQPKVTDTQCKRRLIKGSGLQVHLQHDASSKERNFTEKSSITMTNKEHVLKKLRRCESVRISSPVRSIASSPKKNISSENTTHGTGIKRKATQRSFSFDFKSSQPVSPLGSPSLSREKLDKAAASFVDEVGMPFESRDDHRPVTNTANKRPRNILRKTNVSGHENNAAKNSICWLKPERKTGDVDVKTVPKLAGLSRNAVKSSNGHSSLKPVNKPGDVDVKNVPKSADLSTNAENVSNGHTSLKPDKKRGDVHVKNVQKIDLSKNAAKSSNGHMSLKLDKKTGELAVKNVPMLADLSKTAAKSSSGHTSLKLDKKAGDVGVKNVPKQAELSKNAVKSSNDHATLKPDKEPGDVDVKNVPKLVDLSKNTAKSSNGHASLKQDKKIGGVDVKNFPEHMNLSNNALKRSNGCNSLKLDRKAGNDDVENVSKLTEVSGTVVASSNDYTGLKPERKTDDVDVETHPKLTDSKISNGYTNGKLDRKADDVDSKDGPNSLDARSDNKTNRQLDRLSSDSTILSALSHPSSDCVWRGIFEVEKREKYRVQCHGLQAHLSSSASPKVAELVSEWPSEIILKEVCKNGIWPDQFHKYGTSENDIAVYFFAEDLESYVSYQKLLDCLLRNNLALQSNVNGVELLVFSSHCLPQRSQRWNKLFYLWGVLKAKRPSSLGDDVCAADLPKCIHNHDSERLPSCQQVPSPVPRYQNDGVSEASSVSVSPQGCGFSVTKEYDSADIAKIKLEVGDDSTSAILAREMLDLNDLQAINRTSETKTTTHQSSVKSELAVEGSASLNKIGFIGGAENETKASLSSPTSEFSPPLNSLLDAVEMVEDTKTSHVLQLANSNISSHCRIDMQVDLEMDQPKNDSVDLDISLQEIETANNGELNLLLLLPCKKDGQIEYYDVGDACGGSGSGSDVNGNLSLDLSLALPSENEQLVLKLEDMGLPEKNDVDTSLQLFGGR